MKLAEMDLMDEVFTHFPDDDSKQTSWNATKLFEFTVANDGQYGIERYSIPVDDEHAHYCLARRGVENDRLEVLMKNPSYLQKPILFVLMEEARAGRIPNSADRW